jgi:hypothetical protein
LLLKPVALYLAQIPYLLTCGSLKEIAALRDGSTCINRTGLSIARRNRVVRIFVAHALFHFEAGTSSILVSLSQADISDPMQE